MERSKAKLKTSNLMTNSHSTAGEMTLTQDQIAEIHELTEKFNENLLDQGRESANKAFNLGCSVGIIPSLVLIIITLIITKGSWIATGLISIMMGLGLIALANLSAYIARSKSYERVYETEIMPNLEQAILSYGIERETYEQIAIEVLPYDSPLKNFFTISPIAILSDDEDNKIEA